MSCTIKAQPWDNGNYALSVKLTTGEVVHLITEQGGKGPARSFEVDNPAQVWWAAKRMPAVSAVDFFDVYDIQGCTLVQPYVGVPGKQPSIVVSHTTAPTTTTAPATTTTVTTVPPTTTTTVTTVPTTTTTVTTGTTTTTTDTTVTTSTTMPTAPTGDLPVTGADMGATLLIAGIGIVLGAGCLLLSKTVRRWRAS